jgi:dihydrofolate reductase
MSRTRLSVFIASSLDGYIATRAGSLAWLELAARSDEDYGYESFMESVDALAMGRGTYDHVAHLDPNAVRRSTGFRVHPPVSTGLRLEGVQSRPSGFVNLTYSRVPSAGP